MKIKAKKVSTDEYGGGKGCALITCIDPKTGMLRIVKASKGCPRGYMRRVFKASGKGIMLPPDDEDDD